MSDSTVNHDLVFKKVVLAFTLTVIGTVFVQYAANYLGYNSHFDSGFGFPFLYSYTSQEGCVISDLYFKSSFVWDIVIVGGILMVFWLWLLFRKW